MLQLALSDWRQSLVNVVKQPQELWQLLQLDATWLPAALRAHTLFPLRVPRSFVARMRVGDLQDPLLRQVLPLDAEQERVAGFVRDPLNEQQTNVLPGLLHKYAGRVLLTVTGACGVHCRYCFRRHFPYAENQPSRQSWQAVLDYIAADPRIHEVIFSGGDPLVADDEYLLELIARVAAINSVSTLRIHSRMPIIIPERMTTDLLQGLARSRLQVVLVLHCNHANELDASVQHALHAARDSGITLLNQSVLLRGVNDTVHALRDLSEALFTAGVLPYYLHLLDKVQGAAHFDVEHAVAKQLWQELQYQLPGYLVPRLVHEQAGARAKTII